MEDNLLNELDNIKEENKISVISAVYIRLNNEMRMQNVQDIKKDISYRAKDFGLMPEKYITNMSEIVRSYIEQINRLMKVYNDRFMNIQNILYNAKESKKTEESYQVLNQEINEYKKKLAIYEQIIAMCDKEFEECKNNREMDFKELFEIKQENALAIIQHRNPLAKLINCFKTNIRRYDKFSKAVLKKYASTINNIRIETMSLYINKVKKDILIFSSRVNDVVKSV